LRIQYKERGTTITGRKTTTSSAVKQRWKEKTYKRYTVNLRKEEDADLIQFIEQNKDNYGPTEIFRIGVKTIKKGEQ